MRASFLQVLIIILLLPLFVLSTVTAQEPDADSLRKQIEALQGKLNAAESADLSRRNVTQIGSSRPHGRNPGMIVRIYDLGDLFAVAPPYAATRSSDLARKSPGFFAVVAPQYSGAGGGFGGGGGGLFNIPPNANQPGTNRSVLRQVSGTTQTVRSSQDQLTNTIKTTISPEVWTENGGTGTIATLGNAFIISADENTHRQIDSLLNLFRERGGTLRTISVRAWWLWLSEAEIAPLLESNGEPVGGQVDHPAFGIVKDETWAQLMKDWQQPDGRDETGYQATITCYNGQTVHTISGDQSLAVVDIRPVVTDADQDGEKEKLLAYQPKVAVIHNGIAMQVTPMSNVSGKTVLLDIHSRVTQQSRQAAEKKMEQIGRGNPTPKQIVAAIDRPVISSQQLSTTLRLPVNRPMLVGGMTFGKNRALYMFVKVSVQELRNDNENNNEAVKQPTDGNKNPVSN